MSNRYFSMARKPYLLVVLLAFLVWGCEMDKDNPEDIIPQLAIENLNIPDGFDFSTTQAVDLNVQVLDNMGNPMSVIPVDFYRTDDVTGDLIKVYKGISDQQGYVTGRVAIPTSVTELILNSDFIGLLDEYPVQISNGHIDHIIGGVAEPVEATLKAVDGNSSGSYLTLGSWNTRGKPNYLVGSDPITTAFLDDINASLPEGTSLPVTHPVYFQTGISTSLHLTETAEVWVTFVHEGAGWMNSLGFYTYTEGYPPADTSNITNATIIFPNVSYTHNGGVGTVPNNVLHTGDKVYLGLFPAGTVIEWFLVAQGWQDGPNTVENNVYTHFSQSEFNVESNPNLQQHTVLLYDATRQLVLISFEDINRELSNCDQDFNDAIFYATVSPFTAIDPTGLPPIDTPIDTDGDGVSDTFDEYPNDPARAYNVWAPSEGLYGTLAFEDMWPEKGDFDFNDVVIDYQYQIVSNSSNELVEMFARYSVRATGASYHNGFGVELPLLPTQIASVTGGSFGTNITSRAPNGTEVGQNNAVIIAFENAFDLLPFPGGGIGTNTTPGAPWVQPNEITQLITFTSGILMADLGTAPFNPFIFVDQQRSVEVHLSDHEPTDLADLTLLGTGDDHSSVLQSDYYKTQNKLPWAIHIPESFVYPIEKKEIPIGHLMFSEWAESAGVLYPDWYMDKSGYRDAGNLY